MRPACPECITKHIGQALVLLCETKKGYEHHLIYAVGHLAEAEDEASEKFPKITNKIRQWRIAIMEGEAVDFDEIADFIFKWRKVMDK